MFCLRPEAIANLKEGFRNGDLSPDTLNVDSKSRRELLSKYIGEESAKEVSLLYEKKLLLKNQERAMYDFAREVTGLSVKAKEELSAKIKKNYEEKARRIYDPKDDEVFLNEIAEDIYSKKYNTEISLEEAQTITGMAQNLKVAKDKMNPDFTWKSKEDAIDFGASKVALDNYVGELKKEAAKEGLVNPLTQGSIAEGAKAVANNAKISFNFIADNSRSILASMDNSLWFRQGIKALVNPKYSKAWVDNFVTSWSDIGSTLYGGNKTGDAIIDAVKAEIYSRQNYLNGRYEMGKKLDIGTGEEAYPTSLPSKIPLLGRLFRASEVAYEAGAMRLRADIADTMYEIAEKNGVDMNDKAQVGDINEVVNSMTGRGRLGVGEKSARFVNSVFFSIKFLKSNIDTLTLHQGKLSNFATKQAANNILYAVSSMGIILSLVKLLDPDRTDLDPRGSLFGKIKLSDNTAIDITGGMASLIVLASRILTQESKNSKTGITSKLGEGFGSADGFDVLTRFMENKFSPMYSTLRDIVRQKDFKGNDLTVAGTVGNLVTPIPISNLVQSKDEKAVVRLAQLLLDGVGFSSNTAFYEKDWGQDAGKELTAFKKQVGDEKFKEANDKFNDRLNERLNIVVKDKEYKALSNDDKKKLLTREKTELKEKIFREYNFKYKSEGRKELPRVE